MFFDRRRQNNYSVKINLKNNAIPVEFEKGGTLSVNPCNSLVMNIGLNSNVYEGM